MMSSVWSALVVILLLAGSAVVDGQSCFTGAVTCSTDADCTNPAFGIPPQFSFCNTTSQFNIPGLPTFGQCCAPITASRQNCYDGVTCISDTDCANPAFDIPPQFSSCNTTGQPSLPGLPTLGVCCAPITTSRQGCYNGATCTSDADCANPVFDIPPQFSSCNTTGLVPLFPGGPVLGQCCAPITASRQNCFSGATCINDADCANPVFNIPPQFSSCNTTGQPSLPGLPTFGQCCTPITTSGQSVV